MNVAVLGLLIGLAIGTYLPLVYRQNVGFERDERVERIDEKASSKALQLVQMVGGAGVAYAAFVRGEAETATFTILTLTFFLATFGHLLLKVYYSRVI
jgi:uncharacterized membrane protein